MSDFLKYYRVGLSRLRTSRSHESLLCGPGGSGGSSPQNAVQTVDLSSSESGDIGVKQLHQSVLGEDHCLQITRPSGNVYIACSNAEERDRWRNWYTYIIKKKFFFTVPFLCSLAGWEMSLYLHFLVVLRSQFSIVWRRRSNLSRNMFVGLTIHLRFGFSKPRVLPTRNGMIQSCDENNFNWLFGPFWANWFQFLVKWKFHNNNAMTLLSRIPF